MTLKEPRLRRNRDSEGTATPKEPRLRRNRDSEGTATPKEPRLPKSWVVVTLRRKCRIPLDLRRNGEKRLLHSARKCTTVYNAYPPPGGAIFNSPLGRREAPPPRKKMDPWGGRENVPRSGVPAANAFLSLSRFLLQKPPEFLSDSNDAGIGI